MIDMPEGSSKAFEVWTEPDGRTYTLIWDETEAFPGGQVEVRSGLLWENVVFLINQRIAYT